MTLASGFSRFGQGAPSRKLPQPILQIPRKRADTLSVERRFDHRYLTGLGLTAIAVRVTDLAKPERSGEGRMNDISDSGMGISVPFELAAGDVIQIEVEDSRLFGFVVHANREDDGWRAGIELQRVLMGGSELSRVLYGTLRRALPQLPGLVSGNLQA